ncbi:Ig-like domain-containing protein [Flavobacterium psychrotrophum]|uniref:Ig-like domain-containing protein n=1 Tax=Flavobacterium psychrotrophum TaxID=2294119 RepID=UPI000E3197F9|nr:Ig-like domain-containing protein [Flavobacterium psychrotrophum]
MKKISLLIKKQHLKPVSLLWLVCVFMLFTAVSNAQTISYYSFNQTEGMYTPLFNGTNIATATAASGTGGIDDQVYTLDNVIPFNFNFNGQSYTSLKVYANGFVSFGATASNSSDPIGSSNSYEGVISPLAADLDALYNINGDSGNIAYEVIGTAPNREFVVQWSHFRPYSSTAATVASHHNWNFQARLKEDGTIRFVYALSSAGTPSSTTAKVGLRGTTYNDYNNRTAAGTTASNWNNTVAATTSSGGISTNYNYLPSDGLTFTWTPPAACLAPVTQPTALVLNNTGIIINASFAAAVPAADRYLVLRNIAGTTPNAPVNGTTYATGVNTNLNSYVAYYGTATSFENNYNHGIRGNNNYVYTIYAVSSNCNGGPLYNTTAPLTGNITNCPATVNGITSNAITSTGFTLAWPATDNGNAREFTTVLEVATNSTFTNMVTGSPFTLSSFTTSQSITGLQPNTQYFYRAKNVVTECESSYSTVGNVYTSCIPVSAFNEGFDGVTGLALPNCWSKILVGAGGPPTINVTTTDALSAPNNVSFYGNGADTEVETTKIILVSPEVNNLSAGTHRLRFKARKTSSTSTAGIRIVALDGNTAEATSTIIESVTTLSTTYQEYTVYFTSYTGTGNYIGIQRVGGPSYSYVYVDDVVWEPVPSCIELQAVTATEPTPTGATISWTNVDNAAPQGGYEYFVSTTNTTPDETQTFVQTTQTSATLTGLASGVRHYVFVRRICNATEKSPWVATNFTTIATAPAPWIEEFLTSSYPTGWTTTNWSLGTTRGITGEGNSATSLYKNLFSGAATGTFTTIAVGPLNASNYELSFYHKQSNYNGPYAAPANWGNFTVQVSDDFGATWNVIDTIENESNTGYTQKVYSLANYQGNYVQVKIVANWTSGDFDLSFDKFEIKAPAVAVENVLVTVADNAPATITTENGTLQLQATVNPAGTNQEVTWSVFAGSDFASVSESGLVTAIANGTVTVRATSNVDATKFEDIEITIAIEETPEGYCEVSVEYDVEPITLVNFANLNKATAAGINNTPAYEDFTALIANVNREGIYTMTVKGNTGNLEHDIRVFIDWNRDLVFDMDTEYYTTSLPASTGEDTVEATLEITVPENAVLGNTRMRIIKDMWNVYEEGEFDACTDAYYGQIEDYTVTVAEAIEVTSVLVTTQNNVTAEITVENGTLQLVAAVNPQGANQDVTWSVVSGAAFATLSESGLVTALANGTVVVRATSVQDATKFDDIEVTINYVTVIAVESVTVATQNNVTTEITVENGTLQLVAAVNPQGANQYVTWSVVSGAAFATLSESGLVTALANGTVVVRATSVQDATKFDDIEVTINYVTVIAVESVTVATQNNVTAEITVENGTLQLVATVNPQGANQDVTWSVVSGAAFATLSESGLVTALANGTVVVRATSVQDATKFDDIEVVIDTALSNEDFDAIKLTLYPNPVSSILYVETPAGFENYEILDITGKSILNGSNKAINFESVSAGTYLVKINLEDGKTVTRKIIKK